MISYFLGKVRQKTEKRSVQYSISSKVSRILVLTARIKRNGKWVTITLNTCKRLSYYFAELEKGGCAKNADDYEYHCRSKTQTCMYSVSCKFDITFHEYRCKETHFFTGWTCCDVKCAWTYRNLMVYYISIPVIYILILHLLVMHINFKLNDYYIQPK
jgi:hypothetical protein